MSRRLPWIKFYARDTLAGGMMLDVATFGVDMRLRLAWWAAGGNLPDDPKKLARIAGIAPQRFSVMRNDLMASGWQVGPDGWFRDDLREDFCEAKANSDQASGAAKSRWKKKTGNADAYAPEDAPAVPIIVTPSVSDKSTVSVSVNLEKAGDAEGDGDAAARAFQFIEVFDRSLVSVFGEKAKRKKPSQTDFPDAQQLISDGVSLTQFGEACIRVMSRLPRDGSNTPGSISYIARDIRTSKEAATRKGFRELAPKSGAINGSAHNA